MALHEWNKNGITFTKRIASGHLNNWMMKFWIGYHTTSVWKIPKQFKKKMSRWRYQLTKIKNCFNGTKTGCYWITKKQVVFKCSTRLPQQKLQLHSNLCLCLFKNSISKGRIYWCYSKRARWFLDSTAEKMTQQFLADIMTETTCRIWIRPINKSALITEEIKQIIIE